jgi:hypothetical protein
MFWNKTITLYNKYEDEQTGLIRWYRKVIENCFVKTTNNKVTVGNVLLQSDENIVRVGVQSNYLAPYKWRNLPNDQKTEYITLQNGDLIFFGEIAEDIDELTPGKRSTDIVDKYSAVGSMVINAININDFVPGAHYFIRGE